MRLNGFYRAVVEDNNDPDKLGRVRVRIWGLHSEEKNKTQTDGIPTNELPWAEPCLPIMEGGISGFGMFGIPVQGSHVMVFFENGHLEQPRYFATMPGKPTKTPNIRNGFNDPDGNYPTSARIGESDYHRLSRGESDSTLVTTKNDNREVGIAEADGGTWDEPTSPYNAQYPHNFVFTTHGGLTLEFDSTPGSKRFHIYHPSNTYIECDNDGNLVIKNNANKYDISKGDRKEYVVKDHGMTVDGDQKLFVGGDKSDEVRGDFGQTITGSISQETEAGISQTAGTGISQTAGTTIEITATGAVTITGTTITLSGPVVFTQASGGGGAVEISGTSVHLNPP